MNQKCILLLTINENILVQTAENNVSEVYQRPQKVLSPDLCRMQQKLLSSRSKMLFRRIYIIYYLNDIYYI